MRNPKYEFTQTLLAIKVSTALNFSWVLDQGDHYFGDYPGAFKTCEFWCYTYMNLWKLWPSLHLLIDLIKGTFGRIPELKFNVKKIPLKGMIFYFFTGFNEHFDDSIIENYFYISFPTSRIFRILKFVTVKLIKIRENFSLLSEICFQLIVRLKRDYKSIEQRQDEVIGGCNTFVGNYRDKFLWILLLEPALVRFPLQFRGKQVLRRS